MNASAGSGRTGVSALLAFVCGVIAVQTLAGLPSPILLAGLAITALALLLRRRILPCAFLLGFVWASAFASVRLHDELPRDLEGRDITLEGTVASLPEPNERGVRFEFDVGRIIGPEGARVPGHLRLTWYDTGRTVRAGERWRLGVRLKRPHGMLNPGGMDYELWLFSRNIRALGYVRESPGNVLLNPANPWLPGAWRQQLSDRIHATLAESPFDGVIRALVMGAEDAITPGQWEVLRRTGTAHLIAISGSHISLIALLAYSFAARLAALLQVMRWPPPAVAAVAAVAAAAAYSALTGFAIPTQRALIMIAIAVGGIIAQRHLRPAHTLALALAAVVLIDPPAVTSPGFWLSFLAVAFILYLLTGRLHRPGLLRELAWTNWATSLGLAPVLLFFFGQISLVSPLANLFAVPVLGLAITPLALFSALMLLIWAEAGAILMEFTERLVAWAWQALEWLSGLSWAQWQHAAPPPPMALLAALGAAVLMIPRGIPGRWLGLFLLLPAAAHTPDPPPEGRYRLTLLDVGQALASVVETHAHTLVFDTGARLSDSFDMGAAVVEPYLRSRGISAIDTLVVSHGDNDHIGGAATLLRRFPVTAALSSVPDKLAHPGAKACRAGQSWEWDGVQFEMLWPDGPADNDNDASCVLRVSGLQGSALLTGDIERGAESSLVARYGAALASTVLVAPHHGSKTSSSPEFLGEAHPALALVSAGYRNRWGFPSPQVVERYRRLGIPLLDTASGGALIVQSSDSGGDPEVQPYRWSYRRYWHDATPTKESPAGEGSR
ncbi:DNA internalization-related competence protein ComEC/Rec2 [Methylococcus geothermalis]|uniref:DNA internalization-related competence protein ComEC/Rec2 n=1 Tax=Methylococcus geothermalis TaxID=2681310 RepID=UPI001E4369D4|nr:DNA internalization-related competence protein ComEC/Rec2 [Methylococcus geothermalis]